jgi:uncharacterized protein YcfJ
MDGKLIVGMVGGVAVALAGSAIAYRLAGDGSDYAKVVSVTPAVETVVIQSEECRDEPVVRHYKEDKPNVAGTAIGAVVGGVVGNQIGSGSGRKAATVAGAVAGGVIGNRVQERNRPTRAVSSTERRCETVEETVEQPAGFDVVYSYQGEVSTVRMESHPGDRILMTTSAVPAAPVAKPEN